VDVWNRGHAISFCCVKTLKKLKTPILTMRSLKGKYFLQHDSARPQISILTRETIAEFGWITAVWSWLCAIRLYVKW
jgi:hypothetical protein